MFSRLAIKFMICVGAGLGLAWAWGIAVPPWLNPFYESPQAPRRRAFEQAIIAPRTGPNVVLITIDALRADHTGLGGYHRPTTPAIDRFFARGRVFDRAYSPAAFTTPSLVGMLTGLYPHHHGVRLLCQKIDPQTVLVTEYLRRAGYQTAAVVSNAVLADSACGLAPKFDHYDDNVSAAEAHRAEVLERPAAGTTDDALSWLKNCRDPWRPFFLWVHYIDPHGPYRPPPGAPRDFTHDAPREIDPARVPEYSWEPGVNDGLEYIDRYDEEIAYTDREVGRLLGYFESHGRMDQTLVILTADHGEYMMEQAVWFEHTYFTFEPVVRVPLAIRGPGTAPGRISTPVSIVDVAPTVLAAVGLPPASALDGRPLSGDVAPRPVHVEGQDPVNGLWRALIEGTRKLVAHHVNEEKTVVRTQFFDLAADPDEKNPQAAGAPEPLRAALQAIIAEDPDSSGMPRWYETGELAAPGVGCDLNDEMRRKLKSLGYL